MNENEISEKIIGAAIEVHRILGPGLLESGIKLGTDLRLDLLLEDKVIVDLKAREKLSPLDEPQLLTSLRLSEKHLGLIINFHVKVLRQGITRVVNKLPEENT
ncbi:GxxExxY protein [candidate division CSSED10-310 bacterium]|uniref:GxxExxY protein n=1 Tax=candidate division CSSED10-310 bacterium TaxID=2855610 RepID=A0ABV6YZT1_UNCC1